MINSSNSQDMQQSQKETSQPLAFDDFTIELNEDECVITHSIQRKGKFQPINRLIKQENVEQIKSSQPQSTQYKKISKEFKKKINITQIQNRKMSDYTKKNQLSTQNNNDKNNDKNNQQAEQTQELNNDKYKSSNKFILKKNPNKKFISKTQQNNNDQTNITQLEQLMNQINMQLSQQQCNQKGQKQQFLNSQLNTINNQKQYNQSIQQQQQQQNQNQEGNQQEQIIVILSESEERKSLENNNNNNIQKTIQQQQQSEQSQLPIQTQEKQQQQPKLLQPQDQLQILQDQLQSYFMYPLYQQPIITNENNYAQLQIGFVNLVREIQILSQIVQQQQLSIQNFKTIMQSMCQNQRTILTNTNQLVSLVRHLQKQQNNKISEQK